VGAAFLLFYEFYELARPYSFVFTIRGKFVLEQHFYYYFVGAAQSVLLFYQFYELAIVLFLQFVGNLCGSGIFIIILWEPGSQYYSINFMSWL